MGERRREYEKKSLNHFVAGARSEGHRAVLGMTSLAMVARKHCHVRARDAQKACGRLLESYSAAYLSSYYYSHFPPSSNQPPSATDWTAASRNGAALP